jgi:hypothetical protein
MEAPPETKTPARTKRSFFWIYFVLTPVMVLVLYVLSAGPVFLMVHKGSISPGNGFVYGLYAPFGWVYANTPLQKPLGVYMHLWVPDWFEGNGEMNEGPE